MKVLVTDKVSEQGINILQQEFEVTQATGLTEAELSEKIKDHDALIVRSGTQVTEKVINSADKLKVIGRAGVGVDNIDTQAATRRGILVINTPGGNTISAAEHTVAMILSLSRNIPSSNYSLKNGNWERKKYTGVEVKDKVVGIIGLGKIGAEVAKRLKSMGMKVLVYDPYLKETGLNIEVNEVDLETLIKESDYITIHVPFSERTKYLIDREQIAKMKDGVRIINCARGGIVDEDALHDALYDGKVAGAALDVFETEPPKEHKLFELDNVVVTPHLAASTAEAQINVAIDLANSVLGLLKYGNIKNAVNMKPVTSDEWNYINPFVRIAEKMGDFYSQYKNGNIDKIEMLYYGDITEHQTQLVTSSAAKGLFNRILQENINIVNAYQVIEERGIEIRETYHRQINDYSNLIILRVYNGDHFNEVKVSVYSKKDARIVNVNGYDIDMIPEGYNLLIGHTDQPGMIAKVSSILGEHDINIATMQVGRKSIGGDAMMVLSVDENVPKKVVEQIQTIDSISSATMITL